MKTLHYKGSTINAASPYFVSSTQKSKHTWFDKGILIVAVVSCSVAIAIANRPRPAEKLGLEYLKNGRYKDYWMNLIQSNYLKSPDMAD